VEVNVMQSEEIPILFDQRILGFGQHADQLLEGEARGGNNHWKATDKFREDAVLHQITRLDLLWKNKNISEKKELGKGGEKKRGGRRSEPS